MAYFQLLVTVASLLLSQVRASYGGSCAHDCIENLDIPDCNRDDFPFGWDCVCTDQSALESVNNCITSSCSSSDQNTIFGNMAQACANRGSPITAVPAEATFSATSGGTLFASGFGFGFGPGYGDCASGGPHGGGNGKCDGNGWRGHCSWTTFTGNWGGWGVSWSGFDGDDDCSTTPGSTLTTAPSPSGVSAITTGTASPSLGATVTTTFNGQTLTGTIFSAQGEAVSTTGGTTAAAAQNGAIPRTGRVTAFAAILVALLAAFCML